ncbi:MAG: hypothetical protein KKA61_02435 [Nanoarchaeota archaeon]|nr:hypothetical protein [Nanoarchaeota archaeon]
MDTANIIYVKALRENGQKDRPDPIIREAVENINETYKRVGVPYKLKLFDIESFLNKLNKKDLVEIVQEDGSKKDLIEKIQEEIPFEEARRREGVILKDGEWYHNDKKLEPLKLEDITIDYENFKFIRKFDFHQNPEKYDTNGWKIHCMFNKKDQNNIIHQVKYSKKQFAEKYVPKLKNKIKEVFEDKVKKYNNIKRLENLINDYLTNSYLKGNVEAFNKNYKPYELPSIKMIDLCMIYLNSIQDKPKKKFEFERFIEIINNGFKINSEGYLIRIKPSQGYESADYPYLNKLTKFINQQEGNNKKLYVLTDKFSPNVKIIPSDKLFYFMFRQYNDFYSGIRCVGNLSNLREESVRFLLEHELCHLLDNDCDDVGDSKFTIHSMSDTRLMSAPAHYVDLRTGKIDFNLGKISDESVREAYKNIIK